jgi:CheY-like chemotaxis protein
VSRILVVDDEPDILLVVRTILSFVGHEILEASSGEEAMCMLERTEPELMLLDIRLPGIDGVEVLRQVQASGRLERMSVIVLSAHSGGEIADRCMELGCAAFVRKPFASADLRETVERALRDDASPAA